MPLVYFKACGREIIKVYGLNDVFSCFRGVREFIRELECFPESQVVSGSVLDCVMTV